MEAEHGACRRVTVQTPSAFNNGARDRLDVARQARAISQSRRGGAGRKPADGTMRLLRDDLAELDDAYLTGLDDASLRALSVQLLADLK